MKILMITPYFPYPLYSGGQTRSFNLIKNLSKNHQITLFSFIRSDKERKYIKNLTPYCKKISVFKRRPAWSLLNIILSGFTWYPFLVCIYLSRTLSKKLTEELNSGNYNLIHAETFYVMPNIPKTYIPTLLVEQTIEYQVYQHFMKNFSVWAVKPLLFIDVLKVKFWETYYWRKAQKVVAVSEDDENKMKNLIKDIDVDVVPNGVENDNFPNRKYEISKKKKPPTILYVGNFKWLQNREAVQVLIKEIWPKIKKELPKVNLWIVGRSIDNLRELEGSGVKFDETIEDIRYAYKNADLVLAPIKGPGGTRLKVLEAMASGCPVITTSVGIEGIEAEPNRDVLIGNNNQELTRLSIQVLKDPKLSKWLSQNGKKLVEEKYNWKKITKELERIYSEVGER